MIAGKTDIDTDIWIAWIARLSRWANVADDILLSSGDHFLRTVFGTTLHNGHAKQHTSRTNIRPNFFENDERAKQKAEGCVYATIAKRMRISPKHYLSLLRALSLEIGL